MPLIAATWIDGSSGTFPAHQAGDTLVVLAVGWSSGTPSAPAGWTTKHSSSSTWGRRLAVRTAPAAGTPTGTWTNAQALYVEVRRDEVLGNGTTGASTTNAAVPALTMSQPGTARVGAVLIPDETPAGTPTGMTSTVFDGFTRWAETSAPVASWSAQTLAGNDLLVTAVYEVIPTVLYVTAATDIAAQSAGYMSAAHNLAASSEQYTVTAGTNIVASSAQWVTARIDVAASSASRGSWRDVERSPAYQRAITARRRTLVAWGGLVDRYGNRVPVVVGRRKPSMALPLRKATVAMYGERAESWEATLEFSDRWMVPTRPDHPFWGLSNLRVRLYHRILSDEGWLETVVCTVVPQDPDSVDADGLVSTTMQGADVLSTARGDYGAGLDVSGLTLDDAIRAIFERVAPTLNVKIAPTTVTAPDPCILGDRTPAQDWTDFAAAAWPQGVVRSDREGIVFAGPRPEPGDPVDWQQVPSRFKRALNTSAMGNRVTVVSTHPDATGLHVTVMDDNPASPTSVQAWGEHPLPSIETDLVTSEAGLLNLANMRLGKGLHPTEDVELLVPQRFDLDYQRPALVARDSLGIGGVHRISSWGPVDLPLGTDVPARMPVRLMQRTVR